MFDHTTHLQILNHMTFLFTHDLQISACKTWSQNQRNLWSLHGLFIMAAYLPTTHSNVTRRHICLEANVPAHTATKEGPQLAEAHTQQRRDSKQHNPQLEHLPRFEQAPCALHRHVVVLAISSSSWLHARFTQHNTFLLLQKQLPLTPVYFS